jgi:biotin synthase
VLTFADITDWLREPDEGRLEALWARADAVRREHVGDAVHLRGLLEISNFCDRSCLYCGLRLPNANLTRYRMTPEEIVECAREAISRGYGTVVLQAGEDPGMDIDRLCQAVTLIKHETPLAVTLSLGERSDDELTALRRAGADRYLLRFETSNESLFEAIHPLKVGEARGRRRALLSHLREMGYELGSGVMIGLPGQTFDDLAHDLELFRQLDLDMIGVGPFIPHPDTPLGGAGVRAERSEEWQACGDELTTCKMIALARIMCPRANIPSTTALATINPLNGQLRGLQRGANVIMPNLTPLKYRRQYQIYPDKAGADRTPWESEAFAREQLRALGRPVARGRGDSPNILARQRLGAASQRVAERAR